MVEDRDSLNSDFEGWMLGQAGPEERTLNCDALPANPAILVVRQPREPEGLSRLCKVPVQVPNCNHTL